MHFLKLFSLIRRYFEFHLNFIDFNFGPSDYFHRNLQVNFEGSQKSFEL